MSLKDVHTQPFFQIVFTRGVMKSPTHKSNPKYEKGRGEAVTLTTHNFAQWVQVPLRKSIPSQSSRKECYVSCSGTMRFPPRSHLGGALKDKPLRLPIHIQSLGEQSSSWTIRVWVRNFGLRPRLKLEVEEVSVRGQPNSTKSPRTHGKSTKMNREEVTLELTWLGLVLNSCVRGGSRHTSYYYWIFALFNVLDFSFKALNN